MNMGDIWGASDKPESSKKSGRRPHFDPLLRSDVQEAMLLIHHKIVALHDEYDSYETEVDNEGLRATTGLYPKAWQAIIDLNNSFFYDRPHSSKNICLVANALLDLTHEEWMNMSAARGRMTLDDYIQDDTE